MKQTISTIILTLFLNQLVLAADTSDKELALDLKCSLQAMGVTRFYVDKIVFEENFGLYKAVQSKTIIRDFEKSLEGSPYNNLYELNITAFDKCIFSNSQGQGLTEEFFKQSQESHECLKALTIQNVYMITAGNGVKQKNAEMIYEERVKQIGLPNNSEYAFDMYSSKSLSEMSYKIKNEYFSCKKNIQNIYKKIPLQNLINLGAK